MKTHWSYGDGNLVQVCRNAHDARRGARRPSITRDVLAVTCGKCLKAIGPDAIAKAKAAAVAEAPAFVRMPAANEPETAETRRLPARTLVARMNGAGSIAFNVADLTPGSESFDADAITFEIRRASNDPRPGLFRIEVRGGVPVLFCTRQMAEAR